MADLVLFGSGGLRSERCVAKAASVSKRRAEHAGGKDTYTWRRADRVVGGMTVPSRQYVVEWYQAAKVTMRMERVGCGAG